MFMFSSFGSTLSTVSSGHFLYSFRAHGVSLGGQGFSSVDPMKA
jgi:hypothetical protein